MKRLRVVITLMLLISASAAKTKTREHSLDEYLKQFPTAAASPSTAVKETGSLFAPDGILTELSVDYTAHRVGDPVSIAIVEQTTSANSSTVNTKRDFSAKTGIDGLAGKLNTGGVQTIFSG